jgi:hypothetical protein
MKTEERRWNKGKGRKKTMFKKELGNSKEFCRLEEYKGVSL